MEVVIECDDSEAVILYTLDGSNPCYSNTRLIYSEPFRIDNSTTVHYTAIDKMGNRPMFSYGTINLLLVSEVIFQMYLLNVCLMVKFIIL